MRTKRRRLVLFGSLMLSIVATIWVTEFPPAEEETVVATTVKPHRPSQEQQIHTVSQNDAVLQMSKLVRTAMKVGDDDPFHARSWYVPPPAPPPSQPPKPSAPPLPFAYVGKLDQGDGHVVIYLAKGDQPYAVVKGDTFDNAYRFDGIENGNLVIEYLPLSIRQNLTVGGES